jgi:glycosyltransferase involved in cell wall biosynthesis
LAISPFLWTMGKESGVATLHRTLQEFGRHTEVHLLLPATEERATHDGWIEVRTFRLRGWGLLGDFGPERSLFSRPFPGGRIGRYLFDKVLWLHFVITATWHGWRLNRTLDADVFYGVTPYGAAAAFLLRLLSRGRNVTRLLGTFLAPLAELRRNRSGLLARTVAMAPHFTEVLAFRLPASAVIVTDDGTRGDEVAAALGVRGVVCWRNGLDVPDARLLNERPAASARAAAEMGLPGAVSALYAGQLVRWKRVDRLLRAVRDVRSALEGSLFLTVAGDGPERPHLEALCQRWEIAHLVRFLGAIPRGKLVECHLAASVFACAHDLTCACNATFEAMAAGLPVVATNVGDTAEILTDGQEGFLVDPNRPEQLRQALLTLAANPHLRSEMGRKARERVLRDFGSWEERAWRELELIRGRLEPRAGGLEGAVQRC